MLRRWIQRLRPPVVVVSGLPRSGTSMVMQMLHAGGLPCAQDGERAADADNPRGYFEVERVKALDKGDDGAWLRQHQGQAIKVITFLLQHLPADLRYRVVLVRRPMDEILASQRKMLERRGQDPDAIDDDLMASSFAAHLRQVEAWVRSADHIEALTLEHGDIITRPAAAAHALHRFLGAAVGLELDEAAMARAVDPDLYRNRSPAP